MAIVFCAPCSLVLNSEIVLSFLFWELEWDLHFSRIAVAALVGGGEAGALGIREEAGGRSGDLQMTYLEMRRLGTKGRDGNC